MSEAPSVVCEVFANVPTRYLLFYKQLRAEMETSAGIKNLRTTAEISALIQHKWHGLSEKQRQGYVERAKQEKEREVVASAKTEGQRCCNF